MQVSRACPVPVEVIKLALADDGHGVAGADLFRPDDFQSPLRPGSDDALFGGDAGAERTEKLRPIAAGSAERRLRFENLGVRLLLVAADGLVLGELVSDCGGSLVWRSCGSD